MKTGKTSFVVQRENGNRKNLILQGLCVGSQNHILNSNFRENSDLVPTFGAVTRTIQSQVISKF